MVVAPAALALVAVPLAAQAENRSGNKGHWDRPGAVAHVKFLDYTGDQWPVGTASFTWDEANNIDVDWFPVEPDSTCGPDCVRVRTRAPGDDLAFEPNCRGAAAYWTIYPPTTETIGPRATQSESIGRAATTDTARAGPSSARS